MKLAFECLDLDYEKYLDIDENLFRPADVESLISDSSKAKKKNLIGRTKLLFPS